MTARRISLILLRFVDTTEVTEEPVQVIEEAEPTEEEKIPFTIAGNGEVEDNMMDDPSKEFFTVKTKGGNPIFYVSLDDFKFAIWVA